jgi:hypothetical protein
VRGLIGFIVDGLLLFVGGILGIFVPGRREILLFC